MIEFYNSHELNKQIHGTSNWLEAAQEGLAGCLVHTVIEHSLQVSYRWIQVWSLTAH